MTVVSLSRPPVAVTPPHSPLIPLATNAFEKPRIRRSIRVLLEQVDFTADEIKLIVETIAIEAPDAIENREIDQALIDEAMRLAVLKRAAIVKSIWNVCHDLNELQDYPIWTRKTLNAEIERLYQVVNTAHSPSIDSLGFEALKEVRHLLTVRLENLRRENLLK